MVKMQTKLAIAFLGSTLISVMIWDRGNRNSPSLTNNDDNNPAGEDFAVDDERVFHRSKRQLVTTQLHSIYKQFESLQGCCNVPTLVPLEATDACAPQQQKASVKNRVRTPGIFNNVMRFFQPAATQAQSSNTAAKSNVKVIKTNNNRGKRQAAQKITLSSVCYTDCVFTYMSFLNDTALDLVLIEDAFVNKMRSNEWKTVIQDALYTCEEPAACASPDSISVNSKYCSIKPTIMMNCLRKQMILNCPASSRGNSGKNFQCNSGISNLKTMNAFVVG